ncbi:hypothetical protein MBM_05300 [Drepanopeziza brunnea f. sp. 'multigermtubi' MB_m1]|uniref:Uncharacterized protein n=1 Tax=Marssonina brunnea f. sp. multigermtubi (strain MB_m1) TaxID=1072389 RepID=K1WUT9_MARBU|nr:uncharacterized protein MBM_05300 [Drepanopeziza brunnea f. sp. 'multigermtubi' MB_m1]EKD16831.1 hypothetical protein MBM_05300 [Drepanopeziza brunnea f. sp. 'multigermtubi' MB_m1]
MRCESVILASGLRPQALRLAPWALGREAGQNPAIDIYLSPDGCSLVAGLGPRPEAHPRLSLFSAFRPSISESRAICHVQWYHRYIVTDSVASGVKGRVRVRVIVRTFLFCDFLFLSRCSSVNCCSKGDHRLEVEVEVEVEVESMTVKSPSSTPTVSAYLISQPPGRKQTSADGVITMPNELSIMSDGNIVASAIHRLS